MPTSHIENSHKAGKPAEKKTPIQPPETLDLQPEVRLKNLKEPAGAVAPGDVVHLQRLAGNRAVSRILQRKVTVGAAGDSYEREADRIADTVVNSAPPATQSPIQRAPEEEEEVQTKPLAASISPLIQRSPEDEDELQFKRIQRAPEEEEELQTKPIQRQEDEDELQMKTVQRQEDEEEIQTKPVQRQEDEDELQMKPVQRQEDEDELQFKRIQRAPEEEEELQTKPVQRQEDEEDLQMKPVQRQEDEDELQMKPVQRAPEEEEEVQTKPSSHRPGDSFEAGKSVENRLTGEKGRGDPLPGGVQSYMEDRFGASFDSVRVHNDSTASQLNRDLSAQAFTHGSDIYMGDGKYNPENTEGKRLLAHELTHVIQQSGGGSKVQRAGGLEDLLKEKLKKRREDIAPEDEEDEKDPPTFLEARRMERLKELQQLKGQKTVTSAINPPTLAMLTVAAFKEMTYLRLARRGKIIRAIDEALGDYHTLLSETGGKISAQNVGQAKAFLTDLLDMTSLWLDDHADDTSRSKNRMPGVRMLNGQVDAQIKAIDSTTGQKVKQSVAPEAPGSLKHGAKATQIKQRMEGNVSSILGRFAPIIDFACPTNNSKCEIDVEVKIPVDPNDIGFIGGHLNSSAERDGKGNVKVRTELTVTGGAKVASIVELKGELGGYIEAEAKTAEQSMILVSYGFYRRFRESKWLPRGWANFIWGGTQSQVGYKRSERWAAKVEKDIFGATPPGEEGPSVELGGLAVASTEVGVKNFGKVGGALKYQTGRKYTKESVTAGKGQYGKQLGESLNTPTMRGAQKRMGVSTHAIELSGAVEAGPFSGEMKFQLALQKDVGVGKKVGFDNWDFGVSGTAKLPVNEAVLGGLLTPLAMAIKKGIDLARIGLDSSELNKAKTGGVAVTNLEDVAIAAAQLGNLKDYALQFSADEASKVLSGFVGIKISIGAKKSAGKPLAISISISYEKGGALDLDVVKGKLKKSNKLIGLKWQIGGSWIPEVS